MVASTEVDELPAARGRDDHLPRVWAPKRTPHPLEGIRILVRVENCQVARDAPATGGVRRAAQLLPPAAGTRLAPVEEESEVDSRRAVDSLGQLPRRLAFERIDHPRAVRGRHDDLADGRVRPAAAREHAEV